MATNAVFKVQENTGTSLLGANNAVAFSSNVTLGNLIVVAIVTTSTTTGSVTNVTDSLGNPYTRIFTDETSGNLGDVELYYAKNILGGSNTVTATFSGSISTAMIVREYYGLDTLSPLYQQDGTATGSSQTPTSNTIKSTQSPALLIGVMGQVGITGTISAGTGYDNLTTVSNGNEVAVEDRFVTSTGSYNASFSLTGSLQWQCGIAVFAMAPHGTTTSTSSTSSTSSSISSTSSSTSSTSTSFSSTSVSTSSTSSSISTSSTSSSISSTSSSISSTSTSSTSSSTSVSSTSSSISSTSTSSTSISSTSQSTSISSTSSSFSSTSSSISSTSHSTSSTSVSSTSSSSSTSTTAIPLNLDYSYADTPATAYRRQATTGTNTSGATLNIVSNAFVSAIAASNTIIVGLVYDAVAGSCTGVTDSNGNVYTKAIASTRQGCEIWYVANCIGGNNNVVTAALAFVDGEIFCEEWAGLSALDVTANATGTGLNPTTGATATTLQGPEVVFAVVEDDDHTTSFKAGAGYSNVVNASSNFSAGATQNKIVSSPGPQFAQFFGGSAGNSWDAVIATFKIGNQPSPTTLDLTDPDTSKNIQNESGDDGDYFIQRGSEFMVQEYKKKWTNNTDIPTFTIKTRSTQSTLISPILIQIYNQNSAIWETLAVVNTVPADTEFSRTVTQSLNVSNYYDSNFVVTFRSYQQVI